jgi:hypothetical protein
MWDMDKVLEVINEQLRNIEENRLNRQKVNGFSGLRNNVISAWATDKATDFDGPDYDDGLKDTLKWAYEHGRSMADAVEGYLKPMITGEEWSDAYKELPEMARTFLDGMLDEINWDEVAEHYAEDMNFVCPICKREECPGKDDDDDCENKNDKGEPICPECHSAKCPNADVEAYADCTTEDCPVCGDKTCPAAHSQFEMDCPDYEAPEVSDDQLIFASEAEEISFFTDPDKYHVPEERAKHAIDYKDVEALGGWDAYFALRDKFKAEEKPDDTGGDKEE